MVFWLCFLVLVLGWVELSLRISLYRRRLSELFTEFNNLQNPDEKDIKNTVDILYQIGKFGRKLKKANMLWGFYFVFIPVMLIVYFFFWIMG